MREEGGLLRPTSTSAHVIWFFRFPRPGGLQAALGDLEDACDDFCRYNQSYSQYPLLPKDILTSYREKNKIE